MLNSNLLSFLPYHVRIFYNADIIYLNDMISINLCNKMHYKIHGKSQILDKISVMQVKECYINCVSLRNIVTYLKNVIAPTISPSTFLQMNAELPCTCDPFEGLWVAICCYCEITTTVNTLTSVFILVDIYRLLLYTVVFFFSKEVSQVDVPLSE
jgi:hypothetical protein